MSCASRQQQQASSAIQGQEWRGEKSLGVFEASLHNLNILVVGYVLYKDQPCFARLAETMLSLLEILFSGSSCNLVTTYLKASPTEHYGTSLWVDCNQCK